MKIYCLNLDRRTDRWQEASAEFERVGLKVERVSAIEGDNRPLAFNQSVYKCMELAKGDALLLFEDDVVFTNKYHLFQQALRYLPNDFMTLHLGCNPIGVDTTQWQMPTAYNHILAKLWNCYQSHATFYSPAAVLYILENMRTDVLDEEHNIFDDWLRRKVLSQGRSYVMKPMIAYQRESFSDIWNVPANYQGAHLQGNIYLEKL